MTVTEFNVAGLVAAAVIISLRFFRAKGQANTEEQSEDKV
jgi:hypothetical protein